MLWKTIVSLVLLIFVIAGLIFVSAGTFDYWQAWLFLGGYFAASLAISLWLVRYDRALLERRMRGGPLAEAERSQKVIMTLTSLGFVALLVVPGFDRRFGWSSISPAIVICGDFFLLAGWLGILAVFRENSYAAATIQVASDQRVISSGPYAIVRHPMYAAALVMLLGIPVSLGSWWGDPALGGPASRTRLAPDGRGAGAASGSRRLRRLSLKGPLATDPPPVVICKLHWTLFT